MFHSAALNNYCNWHPLTTISLNGSMNKRNFYHGSVWADWAIFKVMGKFSFKIFGDFKGYFKIRNYLVKICFGYISGWFWKIVLLLIPTSGHTDPNAWWQIFYVYEPRSMRQSCWRPTFHRQRRSLSTGLKDQTKEAFRVSFRSVRTFSSARSCERRWTSSASRRKWWRNTFWWITKLVSLRRIYMTKTQHFCVSLGHLVSKENFIMLIKPASLTRKYRVFVFVLTSLKTQKYHFLPFQNSNNNFK